MSDEFHAAVNLILENSPNNWFELKLRYRYFDGAMDINTYYREFNSDDWLPFDVGGFELMDILDNYRKEVHSGLAKPWSSIILVVDKNNVTTVDYGFGDPDILNR